MTKKLLAFIDTETTGLDFDAQEIIEIGGVIVSEEITESGNALYTIIDAFETKVHPLHIKTANPIALKITKYSESLWENALDLSEAMRIFSEKTKDTIMVCHNAPFDWAFLDKAFRTTGIINQMHHYHTLDTISIAFTKLRDRSDIKHFTLHELCNYFSIKNEKEHSALADARATFELYKKLMAL